MQKDMESILKNLVRIDNIASNMNKKRQEEIMAIEKKYKAEIKKLDRQLSEEKEASKKYLEQAVVLAQKEARDIEEHNKELIIALEAKYGEVRQEVLSQVIHKLFGVEMD